MSQWTHVNAAIRFDSIISLMGEPITEEILGTPSTWENFVDDTILPCGSEGSIQYKILKTADDNSLGCRAVYFWG